MFKKRIILWWKQRAFLNDCLEGKGNLRSIRAKHNISARMLQDWLDVPRFKREFNRVQRYLATVRKTDLNMAAAHGAGHVNAAQQPQEKPDVIGAERAIKIAAGQRHRGRVDRKPRRIILKDLAHPAVPPEERQRLLATLMNKKH